MEITVPSFAKINLVLRVLGRRRDGYHTLETIFQTIDLQDKLHFRFVESSRFHLVLDVGDSNIPADTANLIYKACHAFHETHPVWRKIEVRIDKNIPVESGLGGGSSNAAATLIALSRHYDWPLSQRKLLALARRLGADIPFFLYGGTAMGKGRGDKIALLPDAPPFPVLVVCPGVSCSTAEVYRAYDELHLLTQQRNSIKIHVDQRPESRKEFVSRIENDLEKVVFALYPELDSIKQRLLEAGAVAAALTGSGSAVYGLFSDAVDLEKAARWFPACERTRFLTREEYVVRMGLEQRNSPQRPRRSQRK